ncbi:MAG TPA: ABC transporter substrate-binding protein [Paracoccus sp. (in: a-proteobacteria)]|uniref:ABC transporter substrate-binding protein n=1 Tax=uncultured Paracoccus sp. TaxID=189685 RepID=UPI0026276C21|nr:ABC transporter substrate-binding protein [uncultured Paracoccus sp.]HMQ40979.1 ABC transporter substrate-binding protein [Paracoccus sp. (in: a-proteobacteria)]HMR35171.1 ABC transporter substrate-binding protein [Paracoccus sp. (in: a-proteobacteria)]
MNIKTAALAASTAMAIPAAAAYAAELNLICSADVVICEKLVSAFEAGHSDISVNMVRLSSGEAYAKVRAEGRNPQTDLWWGGTGDPQLQAAADGLTAEYESPMLGELQDWAVEQATVSGNRTVGVYTGALGWGYNTQIFEKKGLKAPACWADLLDPGLKGEIQIADPNSSGTAYTALATLVQLMGEDEAFDYLGKLNANVGQYTKSGSAPVKAAARGETGLGIVFMHDAVSQAAEGFPVQVVAPCEGTGYEVGSMSIVEGAPNPDEARVFYDWVLTPEAQNLMPEAGSYQIPSNKAATISDKVPDLSQIKLIDYDFAEYGSSERRKELLARWDAEIGGRAAE